MDAALDRLAREERQAASRLTALTGDYASVVQASRDSNADDEHDPEGASIAFERSQVGALVRQVRANLDEIRAALARVDAGTYGICERCGQPLSDDRLQARPAARLCVRCSQLG